MARKKHRAVEVFSLSFLDCICCGFGAVILIFVITTGRGLKVQEDVLAAASAQIKSIEQQIAEAELSVRQLQAALQSAQEEQQTASAQASEATRLSQAIQKKESELSELDGAIAARQAQLDAYVEVEPEVPVQQTQPQYLTEFSLEGDRILLLVEASGGMLGENVQEAMDTLRLPPEQRLRSEKWTQVREAVKTLIFYLPEEASYQVVLFNTDTHALPPTTSASDWIPVKDGKARAQIFIALDKFIPAGGANHERAFAYAAQSGADNVVLLTDGLPTQSDTYGSPAQVTETHRIVMLKAAKAKLPRNTPANILLFPMAGDPAAASHMWRIAYDSGGSLITPSPDWPQ